MNLQIFDTRKEMGEAAAADGAAFLRALLKEKDEVNVIFAAAPSQNETLSSLLESEIDFSKINAFHMDEYIGLAEDHPASFRHYLKETLFDRAPFKSVHLIRGDAADTAAECERYAELLSKHPVDVCFLGIGENGHIAFNDPGVAKFDDPVLVKEVVLDAMCRMQQVHDQCFVRLEEVPERAITLTVPALTAAKKMICSVPGKTKAKALRDTAEGMISEAVPATVLRMHAGAFVYADKEAGEPR